MKENVEEEEEDVPAAEVEIRQLAFGIEKIAVDNHGGPMTISELSSALQCAPSLLHRVMRFLVHHRIFKEKPTSDGALAFEQTPISRRLIREGENSLSTLVLLQSSPAVLASWINLSTLVLTDGTSAFKEAYGKDMLNYAASNAA
ncbi:O-methyltransferase [Melia azedarach]|uniref:O-methyltransferase n=1 Tax=Melia azedarach TaxID=155640 RepID=A0ACC1XX43_MELAZ|nr:O-methyltransferase [Melia azedarach]